MPKQIVPPQARNKGLCATTFAGIITLSLHFSVPPDAIRTAFRKSKYGADFGPKKDDLRRRIPRAGNLRCTWCIFGNAMLSCISRGNSFSDRNMN